MSILINGQKIKNINFTDINGAYHKIKEVYYTKDGLRKKIWPTVPEILYDADIPGTLGDKEFKEFTGGWIEQINGPAYNIYGLWDREEELKKPEDERRYVERNLYWGTPYSALNAENWPYRNTKIPNINNIANRNSFFEKTPNGIYSQHKWWPGGNSNPSDDWYMPAHSATGITTALPIDFTNISSISFTFTMYFKLYIGDGSKDIWKPYYPPQEVWGTMDDYSNTTTVYAFLRDGVDPNEGFNNSFNTVSAKNSEGVFLNNLGNYSIPNRHAPDGNDSDTVSEKGHFLKDVLSIRMFEGRLNQFNQWGPHIHELVNGQTYTFTLDTSKITSSSEKKLFHPSIVLSDGEANAGNWKGYSPNLCAFLLKKVTCTT